jgi:hypothetical protein
MPGTAKMHPGVAGIAVIEVPVWRPHNRNGKHFAVVRFRFLDRETTYRWLTAYRTNFARSFLHGVA